MQAGNTEAWLTMGWSVVGYINEFSCFAKKVHYNDTSNVQPSNFSV